MRKNNTLPHTTTIRTRASSQHRLLLPARLLWEQRQRLRSVQQHCSYDMQEFRALHLSVVGAVAEYTYLLPATRCEHHCEPGGLLHLAIDTAAEAAQQASGTTLARIAGGALRDKGCDRAWRFGIFLAGLFRTLAGPGLCARVSTPEGVQWDLFAEPLWGWVAKHDPAHLQLTWQPDDAHRASSAALWIAGRVIAPEVLNHLNGFGVAAAKMMVCSPAVNRGQEALAELLDNAQRVAIRREAQRQLPAAPARPGSRPLHPQLLRVLQDLVKHKWTLNERSGQLWLLRDGTYIDWRMAVADILTRLRSLPSSGLPTGCDELARLLVAHGVLAAQGDPPRYYFTARPHARGLPDPRAKLVMLKNPALLGLDTAAVDPLDTSAEVEPYGCEDVDATAKETAPQTRRQLRPRGDDQDTRMLESFGTAGAVLRSIIQRVRGEPSFKVAHLLPHGVALAYPSAIEPFCDPKRFLHECEAQGWLVAKGTGKRILRASSSRSTALPEQYIVLTPHIGRYLLATD